MPPRTYPRRPELIIGERRCQPRVMAKRRGRPPRSEAERAAQRTRLTEAAMDAVRAGGGDISVADIADSAEVSKPVLYAEFGDKNGIADAISVVLADIVELRIPQATGSPSDPPIREIVTAYIDGLVDTVVAEPELRSFIMRSIRSEDRGLVDNALARVVRLRAEVLVGNLGIEVPTDVLTIMIDGLFGFALSAIESWQSVGSPSQDEFSAGLADVAVASIAAIGSRYSAAPTTPEAAGTPAPTD